MTTDTGSLAGSRALSEPHDGRRDMEHAVSELAERLPDALQPLALLTFNYRWSWTPGGPAVFRDMDPAPWGGSQGNPRAVVGSLASGARGAQPGQPARHDRDAPPASLEAAGGRPGIRRARGRTGRAG